MSSVILPNTTYRPPSPPQARNAGVSLNTIIEEPETPRKTPRTPKTPRGEAMPQHNDKIKAWLSPLGDQFPTPRGFHFLNAPILPSSPSSASMDDEYEDDDDDDEEEVSPSIASSPWNNRSSVMTAVTEFDDLYDVSDEEGKPRPVSRKVSLKRRPSNRVKTNQRLSGASLTPLVIPNAANDQATDHRSGGPEFKKLLSPVAPTPTSKVTMSPAAFSFLQAQQLLAVPGISAPPSLDGSFTSEQLSSMSATLSTPPTPIMGNEDGPVDNDWAGVRLQPAALATLQAISGEDGSEEGDMHQEQVIEIPEDQMPFQEMTQQTPRGPPMITRPALRLSTDSDPMVGLNSLSIPSAMSIPSPGGFFSGLSPRTRSTWHVAATPDDDVAPPTSSTAEQFYRLPWEEPPPPIPAMPVFPHLTNLPPPPPRPEHFARYPLPAVPVEQVIEFRGTMSDGIPTARPVILEQVIEMRGDQNFSDDLPTARQIPAESSTMSGTLVTPESPEEEVTATEIVSSYDPLYAKQLQEEALGNLDRTELWLNAQKAYLKGIDFEHSAKVEDDKEPESAHSPLDESKGKEVESEVSAENQLQRKKTVRFSEVAVQKGIPRGLPSMLLRQESAYYRAFTDFLIRSSSSDPFVHRLPRFEALQASRISLRDMHRNQLLGKFQLSVIPQSAKKRMSANVARGDDVIVDDLEKLKSEKEAEALYQMTLATWHVGAIKALNGGRLVSAPIAKRLARLSRMAGMNHRARILDLGGQATCDWAWHCAITYPNTKVYTVTTKTIRQLSNSNIRGPPNHRQVAVQKLSRLPFPDKHFDLVSARELHSILKFIGEHGEDEWESCLKEVMRVLKPGGYLEFSLLDADIVNAGPLGLAKSVEFNFALKTLGYDPNPTRMFLGRLGRAGFDDVKRAWMCLPMGAAPPPANRPVVRDSTGVEVHLELEAMVSGSTAAAAPICGLAGGWGWERWLLRCETEKMASEGRLLGTEEIGEAGKCLEGVHAVIEEGRGCGSAWRVLNGYARKPREDVMVPFALDI